MGIAYNPGVVSENLIFSIDPGNIKSYSGSGTILKDLSGKGNDGTLINGVSYGNSGGGNLIFDGTDDYVNFSSSVSNNVIEVTTSVWVYITSANSAYIYSKYRSGQNGYFLYYQNDGTFGVDGREQGGGGNYFRAITASSFLPLNWYNIVYVKTSNNWKIYVNSVSEISIDVGIGTIPFNNTANFVIGGLGPDQYGLAYLSNSIVSNLSIYDKALTPMEIKQNFNALRSRFGI